MRNFEGAPAHTIQSVVKAAKVMETLADAGKPLSLSQIAETVGMGLPTAYRFLRTLEFLEWVERIPELKQYRIAPRVVRFAHSFFDNSDLWSLAHQHLIQARRQYNETFNLSILDERDILYIDRVKTRKIVDINLEIGSKLPAFCTSMGRVLLASLPRAKARRLLERSARTAFTRHTIIDTTILMTILDAVRTQGYAINSGEMAPELLSVAAPVRNLDGQVVAAVNMAVNADHYDRSAVETTLIPAAISVAARISKALGYHQ
jgi:IclR family transcriptional regulator, pca regulon regulatory protein